KLAQQGKPLLLKPKADLPPEERERRTKRELREERNEKFRDEAYSRKRRADSTPLPEGMERFRIAVGHAHGVKPGNIMGAIANEAGLEGQYIGRIQIFDGHSLVDLPEGMPKEIFRDLQKTRVAGQALRISRLDGTAIEEAEPELPPFGGKARALREASARKPRSTTRGGGSKPAEKTPTKTAAPRDGNRKPAGRKTRPGKNARLAKKTAAKPAAPPPRARRPGTLTT